MTLPGLLIAATCSSQFDSLRSQAPTPPRHDRVCCSWMSAQAINHLRLPLSCCRCPRTFCLVSVGSDGHGRVSHKPRSDQAVRISSPMRGGHEPGGDFGPRYIAVSGDYPTRRGNACRGRAWSATGDGGSRTRLRRRS
jgi:hypothetical protein